MFVKHVCPTNDGLFDIDIQHWTEKCVYEMV